MERLDVEDRCDGMDIGPNAVFETRSRYTYVYMDVG